MALRVGFTAGTLENEAAEPPWRPRRVTKWVMQGLFAGLLRLSDFMTWFTSYVLSLSGISSADP